MDCRQWQKTTPRQPSNLLALAQARQNPSPAATEVALGLRVGDARLALAGYQPSRRAVGMTHDRA